MNTIEHCDNCQLVYLINSSDVRFVRKEDRAFVQAKITATPDDDQQGNGDGYVVTQMQLFEISNLIKKSGKKSLEPDNRIDAQFLLNQSFLSTVERQHNYLWSVMPIHFTSDNMIIGSVVYEEVGTGNMVIEFYSSKSNIIEIKDAELEYPQRVLP